MLLAVPNFSEGRDAARIATLRAALAARAKILDRHSDRDHHRTVFTIAGEWRPLAEALTAGAEAAIAQIDMTRHIGLHPCVGALDVCPFVYIRAEDRAAAERGARSAGSAIGEQGVPVFLYGDLASTEERRERAYFRSGGLAELGMRMADGELAPDFGPAVPHPTAGATLVTARPPLAAFNVELDTADATSPSASPPELREAGGGLPGVRAIGLPLESGRAQVSTNIHDPSAVPLGEVVERVRELAAAAGGAAGRGRAGRPGARRPRSPATPSDVPIRGFDPEQHVIERRLARPAERPIRQPDHLDSAHGPDEEEAPPQAPRHPGRRIDPSRAPAGPRSREEAKARARAASKPRGTRRHARRPGAARSSAASIAAGRLRRPAGADLRPPDRRVRSRFGAFMLAFYIPAGYFIDKMMWRRRERARIRAQAARV